MKAAGLAGTDGTTALWERLRQKTTARIGLARAGASISTSALLEFRLAHARAKDSVLSELDPGALCSAWRGAGRDFLVLNSRAQGRQEHLLRPDLGRQLDQPSLDRLGAYRLSRGADVALVVVDGLSAPAVERQCLPLLQSLLPLLQRESFVIAPLSILTHGIVAAGDIVGKALGARSVVVLIGERPGLTAHDSLSAYITWDPSVQRTDADRNCVSNIRPEGLAPAAAASKIAYLLRRACQLGRTGVELKDDQDVVVSLIGDK